MPLDVLSIQIIQTMQATYATQVMQVMQVTQTVQATYATQVMQVMQAMQRPPVTVASTTAASLRQTGYPRPGTPHPSREVDSCVPRTGSAGSSMQQDMSPVLARRSASPGLPTPTPPAPKPAASGAGGSTGPPPSPAPRPRNRLPPRPSSRLRSARPPRSGCNRSTPCRCRASASFDSGLLHAGETVRPPPVATTASSTTPAPVHALPTTSWLHDNFDIERALIAGRLPPGFDASQLINKARLFDEFGLADELAAGRLPGQTIDGLMEWFRATDEGGDNALIIEYLRSKQERIERALRDAYPERAHPRWLDHVRAVLRSHGEPAPPSAASATRLAESDVTVIGRFLGTGEGVSHPAPPSPASAAGGTGAGAGATPPASDPWGIRPPGMSSEPHPVAFDPRSAPSGPSSQVGYTRAIRTPVMSTGAPPGSQGAGTPGFSRAASGAVELPFSRREEIAIRFGTADALLDAELTVRLGGADALGWSARRRRDGAPRARLDQHHRPVGLRRRRGHGWRGRLARD